jgi:hypothetical protein
VRRKQIAVGLGIIVVGVAAYVVLWDAHDSARPLMKADGWREHLGSSPPFAILEIALDRETAERAWSENTPYGLPRRSGRPAKSGLYGSLDDVDFSRQAVVVWSSGQSSTCPGWLAGVDVDEDGTVVVEVSNTAGRFGDCTDDYRPHRMLLAVNQDRLPPIGHLPTVNVSGIPVGGPHGGGLVTTYPADR